MSLRNVYDQTKDRLEEVCHQHAVGVIAELQQTPHVQFVDHQQAPMANDDWRWRWCFHNEGWNLPRTTVWLKWSVQLCFSYRHNWLVIAHPNVSGRSLQFAACVVDDNLRNFQRNTVIHGSVYGLDSLMKRLDKNKCLIARHFRYWTFNNHAQNQDQPR